MLYLASFVIGFFGGAVVVFVIYIKGHLRRKTYGFNDNEILTNFVSDDDSKYSKITGTVDGSRALDDFNNK